MNKTALITGASSGIGLELVRIHASKGDNLVLVARRKGKLEELKTELEKAANISVHVIEKDLSLVDAAQEIYNTTSQQNITVDYLINNAGFGDYGKYHESDWNKQAMMIQLNVTALTQLCKLYLKDMTERGNGKIMNVASTAAFQPGPLMSIYYATKSFVLHFSEAIANEVKDNGVTVTALCPGATISGFEDAANLGESKLFKGKKLPSSKVVAEYGHKAMMKGKPVAIHGFMNKVLANSVRFSPRGMVVKITRMIQEKA